MHWDYDNSDGNCWKSGKFALGAILLGMAWKLSQMMHPTLVLRIGIYRTPLLMNLDLGWIPMGECAPLLLEKCVLVIPPSELDEICLKMICLGLLGNGSEGFPCCNVPDLASLGNTANVCVGSKVYSI
jgi:hypothetical protein